VRAGHSRVQLASIFRALLVEDALHDLHTTAAASDQGAARAAMLKVAVTAVLWPNSKRSATHVVYRWLCKFTQCWQTSAIPT
jgi:hypothetical protein